MSVLQSLQQTESSNNPVICDILLQMEDLRNKGFDILFCWVPSHTGIKGNELADSAAKAALAPLNRPLRGTSSLGVTGFTTPRYPSVCSPSVFVST
ncbi:hypothetical protein AVEN_197441-1 [Araneus ventricosus]|uniref:RNase H type-1 domain-containing protein n=1 Tax=Araneus ventricosus TaxID=182803 RepID=A0A4Y2IBJ0_ARAVE|nr:hypothetical protein AVEN_197441-1 [Araneus ventricosus]